MTALPERLREPVAAALGWEEPGAIEARSIGGGCIHPAVRVSHPRPPRGAPADAFLKWSEDQAPFRIEADGLERLRTRGGPVIPEVLGVDDGWLLLEYLSPRSSTPEDAAQLGRELAHLHRPLDGGTPGLDHDGWIATLPQDNTSHPTWADFWRDARLRPQFERAADQLPPRTRTLVERVIDATGKLLDGVEGDGLSLLHGDLWSGNVLHCERGPALVDPAAYRGHREVDLAMMELFGGFDRRTFQAYHEAAPLRRGHDRVRRPLYQLYPLLVHVNLFGTGYVSRTERAAAAVLRT